MAAVLLIIMSWVKIDDQYGDHPKVLMAGPIAAAIHIASMCYCSRYLTDGFLPEAAVQSLLKGFDKPGVSGDAKDIDWPAFLVKVGMWERIEGGYLVHDYLDYNPTKEKVLAERKARKKAGEIGADKRWHGDGKPVARPIAKPIASAIAHRMPLPSEDLCPRPDPTPSRPEPVPDPVPDSRSGDTIGVGSNSKDMPKEALSGKPDGAHSKNEIPYKEIIEDLNQKAKSNYRHTTQKTQDLIRARWNEGFRFEDFRIVHIKKCDEWLGTDMAKYLRPVTLYGAEKFEGYLNQPAEDRRVSDITKRNIKAGNEWLEQKAREGASA